MKTKTTVWRSRCVETADRENALFHFACLFKILDTHRYRLQNSQWICFNQLLSAFDNNFIVAISDESFPVKTIKIFLQK